MTPDLHSGVLPARRHDLAERELDGVRLVYGRGGGPHLLDPFGAALFDMLDGTSASDDLVEDLAVALDSPVDDAARWFARFLADLDARGLLTRLGSSAEPAAEAATGWDYPVVPPSP